MIEKKLSRIEEQLDEAGKKLKGEEGYKVASEVFDRSTLLTLYHLANQGLVDLLFGVIKAGKESNVLLGKDKGGSPVAVKVHLVTASDFKAMLGYLAGDRRFRDFKRNRRGIVYTWVKKEFKNLDRAYRAGVKVPRPLGYRNNVVVMEFVGEGERAAPMLKDVSVEEVEEIYEQVVENYRKLYSKAKLVHSDLSEYNILIHRGEAYFIDLSQAVIRDHPHAGEYFARDMENISRYFRRQGLETSAQEIEGDVKGE